jgi:aryl-alcohol dehydrogenase
VAAPDYAFDTTGIVPVVVNNLLSLKTGGEIGLVALGAPGSAIPVAVMSGKTIHHLIEGDSVPQVFIPRLIALYQAGAFPFDKLVTKYPFTDIDRAIADTQSGAAVKAVLTM